MRDKLGNAASSAEAHRHVSARHGLEKRYRQSFVIRQKYDHVHLQQAALYLLAVYKSAQRDTRGVLIVEERLNVAPARAIAIYHRGCAGDFTSRADECLGNLGYPLLLLRKTTDVGQPQSVRLSGDGRGRNRHSIWYASNE